MRRMAEDLLPTLMRFHREILVPDMQRILGELRGEMNERFAAQEAHFDAIYQRFDRLESEYHMLVVGLKRGEERLSA